MTTLMHKLLTKPLKLKTRQVIFIAVATVFGFVSYTPTVTALSQSDLHSIYNDSVWYRAGGSTGSEISNFCLGGPGGSGPLYGPFFPKVPDTAAFAKAISDYIKGVRQDSPLDKFAAEFVQYGLQFNVNPAMLVGIAQKDTSLATAGYGRPPKYNFGNIRGPDGGDGTGFWTFQNYPDSVQRHNAHLAGEKYLGPPKNAKTVAEVISIWAPPEDGNDTAGYIIFVGDVMKKIFGALENIPPEDLVSNCSSSNDPGNVSPPIGADQSSTPCAKRPGIEDIGIYQGYQAGDPVKIRLCALPNLPSGGEASTPGSKYYVEGVKGRAIVNAAVSGAYYDLANAARKSLKPSLRLTANSSFRTMEQQQDLWNADPDSGAVAEPGYSNHQMGLAVDFDIKGISETISACIYKSGVCTASGYADWEWLNSNASKFGFYQLVIEFWHFSPTGK